MEKATKIEMEKPPAELHNQMSMLDDSAVLSHVMSEPSEEPMNDYSAYCASENVAVDSECVIRSYNDDECSLDEADKSVSSEHSVSEYLISDQSSYHRVATAKNKKMAASEPACCNRQD